MMTPEAAERISRIAKARIRTLADEAGRFPRRAKRDRLLAELPAFLAKLSSAVGETNDQLSEADIVMSIAEHEAQYAAETSLRVRVKDHEAADECLEVAVDANGVVHPVIQREGRRWALETADVFTVQRDTIISWLIELLEARYLGEDAPGG